MTLKDGRALEYLDLGGPESRTVILHPGTPATAGCGALVAEAAAGAGARLIAVSRPGYGASSTSAPGLAAVARDTLELVEHLGIDRVGVHGISGGGPFALAFAAVAPHLVARVVISAGPGSYSVLGGLSPVEAAAVARAEAGDRAGAWRVIRDQSIENFGDATRLTAAEFQAHAFPDGPPHQSYLDGKKELFGVFVADVHRAVQQLDGYVRDILSWGGAWDINLASVTAPVLLIYGTEDEMVPASHGRWLEEALPHAQLMLSAGGHGDATFGLAADAYAFLVEQWT